MENLGRPKAKQDKEAQTDGHTKRGGWITLPFIAGGFVALGLGISGTNSNLQVYMLKKYNVESIDAAQITNIVRGTTNLVPVAAAIIADSYVGCFSIALVASAIAVLSFVLFTLSAALPSLRPPHCAAVAAAAGCQPASAGQRAVLYSAVCLLTIGTGGMRYNVATMGADQFEEASDQDVFFNWYFVFLYTSFIVGDTVIVYVQDSISWALGFGICVAAGMAGLIIFSLGARYYRRPAPKGSPFADLAGVIVAAVRKARVDTGAHSWLRYYVGDGVVADWTGDRAPSKRFRFLNRAAMITPEDTSIGVSTAECTRRLCTVQQVEDLKSLVRVFPLWSSGIFISVSIGVNIGLVVLQALAMDRSLGPHFSVPAGSIAVCSFVAFIVATPMLERGVFPLWHRLTHQLPTPLQRVGVGHVVNIVGMSIAALVERQRLCIVHAHGAEGEAGWVAPMSVMWLLLPSVVLGIGETMHFPGQMAFYYQEFPKKLRSTGTAMTPLLIALGFYLSTVFVVVVRRATKWLPHNINQGRVDNVYWTVAAGATLNFVYFLVCVNRYKYHNSAATT